MNRINNYLLYLVACLPIVSVIGSGNNRVLFVICILLSASATIMTVGDWRKFSAPEKLFIKLYLLYIVWCFNVSFHSEYAKESFYSTMFCVCNLLTFIYFARVDELSNQIRNLLEKSIFIASLLILILAVGSFATEVFHSTNKFFLILNNLYGMHGRIFKTTINLYLIVTACLLYNNKSKRNFVIAINVLAGFIAPNRFFMLFTIILFAIYKLRNHLSKKNYALIGFILITLLVSFLLFAHLAGSNLHITARLYIYDYWLPKIMTYWLYGTGIGIKIQTLVVNQYDPIPEYILLVEPLAKLHAHNLFVDKMIQGGVIGGLLYMTTLFCLIRVFLNSKNNKYLLVLLVLSFIAKNLVDDQTGDIHELIFWFYAGICYMLVKSNKNKINIVLK